MSALRRFHGRRRAGVMCARGCTSRARDGGRPAGRRARCPPPPSGAASGAGSEAGTASVAPESESPPAAAGGRT